jgi:arylsulfatase A-like enzyme
MKRLSIVSAALFTMLVSAGVFAAENVKPNIIFILADDIGYGDFGCYGAVKVRTPNVDRLAAQGLRFTDAHSVASVCTPSRYSFLTGEYAFRKKGTGIASGIEGLLIEPGRTTVPALLKRAGYATGIVGKWHLGLGARPTDYNGEIKPGPLEIGFDYAWILPATGDRVPCVWVEDHRVVNLDPADPIKLDYSVRRGEPRSFVNGIPRIGEQVGGKAALWDDEQISTVIAAKSCAFIEKHKNERFFLEVATHNIHVPRVPNPKFRGKSDCGVRGDTIVEFDWTVGQVLDTLDRLGLADRTLVTRWPGRIRPGVSDALVCQVDMLASFAALTGQSLAEADGPDSYSVLPALLGEATAAPCREYLIEQNNSGTAMALRKGTWKYVPGHGGGKAARRKKAKPEKPSEAVVGRDLPPAGVGLYNLADDLSETTNIAAAQPKLVAELAAKLRELTDKGRSRP